jgi:hypothetical protein
MTDAESLGEYRHARAAYRMAPEGADIPTLQKLWHARCDALEACTPEQQQLVEDGWQVPPVHPDGVSG